jgi:two-component system, sensor histidine kinase
LLETEHFMLKTERLKLIKDVIHPTVSVFKGQITLQKLKLEITLQDQHDPEVIIDQVRIQQVMINLIQNAIKFSKAHDHIKIEISKRQYEPGKNLYTIKVQDQGMGI